MRRVALVLAVILAGPARGADAPSNRELGQGIALVKAGDFESAILPLSAAIQALSPDLKRREELARAFLYLGVAYLELGQELEARGKFREAIRNDPKLRLSPQEFSSQVRRVFEAERQAAEPQKKRRNLLLPLVLVVGGGAASVGIAAVGGSDPPTTLPPTTTTTTMAPGPGPGSTTTTTTAPSGPEPTNPGSTTTTTTTTTTAPPGPTTTTTTLPGSTTTTTTPTTTSTTSTTTTTTTLPACRYTLTPPSTSFILTGGPGTCNIDVNPATCPWNAELVFDSGGTGWVTLNGPTSGNGDGAVNYTVGPLTLTTRVARIRVTQDPSASCLITQAIAFRSADAQVSWASQLDLPGGSGRVVVNGAESFAQEGALVGHGRSSRGWNRIEAEVVRGGKPGAWSFELLGGHQPGTLRALAGTVVQGGADRLVFQLSGRPGEKVVLVFRTAR
jgi:tetratricopeptide (TPR) repeat protein